jgi:hypothetical protein
MQSFLGLLVTIGSKTASTPIQTISCASVKEEKSCISLFSQIWVVTGNIKNS